MNFIGKTVSILIISIVFLVVFRSFTSNSSDMKLQTKSSNLILNNETGRSEIKCASGYTKIPYDLQNLYLKYIENADSAANFSKKLKNEIDFYGYTYSIFDAEIFDETKCSEKEIKRENIRFVGNEINGVTKMYISAIIFNEMKVIEAKSKIEQIKSGQQEAEELQLCVDVQCGLNESGGEIKSFDFTDSTDIEYARVFSDSNVTISAINQIEKLINVSSKTSKLTNSEITQILTQARRIALIKVKESNK